ncbi:MAG: tRNA pseudouridine(13) synthase TruD [Candidatus Omnitrophota bacterium]|nr:tRNA pseudouridine(13) synthase TruD [Candidatus Omnitrophota bacterium]
MSVNFPYRTSEIPGFAFSVKTTPSDFEVDEVLSYEPCGEGEHAYLLIEKTGISTMKAVRSIARSLGVPEQAIGMAGLKDARAKTRQTLSLHMPGTPESLDVRGVRVLNATRHANKLKIGHLRGNRFIIKLREFNSEDVPAMRRVFQRLYEKGMPNYFGVQRFGMHGNTWEIGQAILKEDKALARKLAGWHNLQNRRMVAFYVSAFQSWLFNHYLARRIDAIETLWLGDLAFRHDSGAVFSVEDPRAEQKRVDDFEISPSGPVFGHKMTRATGRAGELEQEILDEFKVKPEDFRTKHARRLPGARRALRVRPGDLSFEEGEDEAGPYCKLCFMLPSGCYATELLGEIGKEKMNYVEKEEAKDSGQSGIIAS